MKIKRLKKYILLFRVCIVILMCSYFACIMVTVSAATISLALLSLGGAYFCYTLQWKCKQEIINSRKRRKLCLERSLERKLSGLD